MVGKNGYAFFRLLREHSDKNYRQIIAYTLIAGMSNTALLVLINSAAHDTIHGQINFIYMAEYLVLLLLFFFSKRFVLIATVTMVERIIANLRLRIVNKVRETDLYLLDQLGTSSIYARLTQDTSTLSSSAPLMFRAMQSAIMIIFVMVYLAVISIPAFFCILVALGIAVALYIFYERSVRANLRRATALEARFFALLDGVLNGIKELKLNRKKNEAVYEDVANNITEGKEVKVENSSQFAMSSMFSEIAFFSLLGVVVFLLPIFSEADADEITKIATAVLFIVGPLGRVVGALPFFARSGVAVQNIQTLEENLKNVSPPAENTDFKKFEDFRKIELREVYFEYKGPSGDVTFKSGPHNFVLNRGDKIFLTGGNGSGKSTFLKLLTTLYSPISGVILVDDLPITGNDRFPFRELFFSIFTDFHLFERLYGVDTTESEVNKKLMELGLTPDKVRYEENKFTNLNLSTGQRKRLALLACLMEDKMIYIMDEVAADQDPEFKKLFYTVFLPKWCEEEGKTIILATHDDGYFQYGEQVVMRNGKIITKFED